MTISRSIEIIAKHLEAYHEDLDGNVHVFNVAEEPKPAQEDSVVITMIKTEEEASLRNGKHYRLNTFDKPEYKQRPVFVNLFLLFSCNHSTYTTALSALGLVMECFQQKGVYTQLDGEPGDTAEESYRIVIEHENLTLEQVNHVWGFLGGKQKPSVVYRMRIVPVEAKDKIIGRGEPILEVNVEGESK